MQQQATALEYSHRTDYAVTCEFSDKPHTTKDPLAVGLTAFHDLLWVSSQEVKVDSGSFKDMLATA